MTALADQSPSTPSSTPSPSSSATPPEPLPSPGAVHARYGTTFADGSELKVLDGFYTRVQPAAQPTPK